MASRRKYSFSKLIGLTAAQLIILACLAAGGSIGAFIDIPSAALVVLLTFFMLLASFGRDSLAFMVDALYSLFMTPAEPNPRFAEIAALGSRYAMASGAIGTLIGIISMLQNLSDPDSIGGGIAVALLTLFYALILGELVFPYFHRIHSMPAETGAEVKLERSPGSVMAILLILLILFNFFMLLCTFT